VQLNADIDDESIFASALRLERQVSSGLTDTGAAWLTVRDRLVNTGSIPATSAMLYHLNFGAPLVLPGTTVDTDAVGTYPRDSGSASIKPRMIDEPVDQVVEAVYAHVGASSARILSPSGLAVSLRWSADTLPYLHQWLLPTRGRWAMAMEPATTPLYKLPTDDVKGEPVTVEPGQHRDHEIHLTIEKRR
jgi:hypothetical protein